jgi:hypothetical protein
LPATALVESWDDLYLAVHSWTEPCVVSDVPVLAGLRVGQPSLFQNENLTDRLWLYELSHQVRQLSADGGRIPHRAPYRPGGSAQGMVCLAQK